ncbi:MAG TPA: cobyrinate a,c-diamide synthase [Desulfobacteria bacterium]|nr:cobyrinate a,c-diamide synthase [Desulfobacteria bacterium]
MRIPRLMIAGTHSGVGKTTITTAVLSLFTKAGLNVQPYKVGPDYIDPSYHSAATGNKCRNLDSWILKEEAVRQFFINSATRADIAVIEGVMGVFDGSSGNTDTGSSAHIAKLLGCPVVLIVDVKSMARSAAAVVLGFKNFDPGLKVAGVILNRVGSQRHLGLVTEAIETYCDVPVLGYIKKNARLELPSRHLGLVPAVEGGSLLETVSGLSEEIRQGIDIAGLIKAAESAGELDFGDRAELMPDAGSQETVRIGIAMDEAFSFYYEDGLEIFRMKGAELIPFSPIHDDNLPPDLHGIYIGGGFPEMFIQELSVNNKLKEAIKDAGSSGVPVFGECGGFMYLSDFISDFEGENHPMVGLIPGRCIMEKKLVGMGYVTARCMTENIIAPAESRIRGHEFHYSRFEPNKPAKDFPYAFELTRNRSGNIVFDGYALGNILGSYLHIHFGSDIGLADSFIEKCREFKLSQA